MWLYRWAVMMVHITPCFHKPAHRGVSHRRKMLSVNSATQTSEINLISTADRLPLPPLVFGLGTDARTYRACGIPKNAEQSPIVVCLGAGERRAIKKPSRSTESRTLCPHRTSSFPQGTFGLRLPGRVAGLRASPTARDEYLVVCIQINRRLDHMQLS